MTFKNKLEKKIERASRELIEQFISSGANDEARDHPGLPSGLLRLNVLELVCRCYVTCTVSLLPHVLATAIIKHVGKCHSSTFIQRCNCPNICIGNMMWRLYVF